jgi:nucleoside-diphosphate-sugar epimerase
MQLFCFGFGYSAAAAAHRLSSRDISLIGTRTSLTADPPVPGARVIPFRGDGPSPEVKVALQGTTHILVSIPPDLEGDVALRCHQADIAALETLAWVGYFSTVGVYGDWHGEWVDETSPTRPISERSLRRLQAEQAWLEFGRDTGRRVEIFRLSGIYGPGRRVVDNLRARTAKRIVRPHHVFNRIHVDDVARVVTAAIDTPTQYQIYNVSDDEPAPSEDVVAYAAELLGIELPPSISLEDAGLSRMAASFWAESKRVRNHRIKRDLGVDLLYPTYREGLRALALT